MENGKLKEDANSNFLNFCYFNSENLLFKLIILSLLETMLHCYAQDKGFEKYFSIGNLNVLSVDKKNQMKYFYHETYSAFKFFFLLYDVRHFITL